MCLLVRLNFFKKKSSRRRNRFDPKVIKIRATLAIFQPLNILAVLNVFDVVERFGMVLKRALSEPFGRFEQIFWNVLEHCQRFETFEEFGMFFRFCQFNFACMGIKTALCCFLFEPFSY